MHRITVEDYAAIDPRAPRAAARSARRVRASRARGRPGDRRRGPQSRSTCRPSATRRWTASPSAPPTSAACPAVLPVVGEIAAGASDPAPLAAGLGRRDHDRRAGSAGRRCGRSRSRTPGSSTGGVEILRATAMPASTCARRAPTSPPAPILLPGRAASRVAAPRGRSPRPNLTEVLVRSRVRVAVVSTGNELVPPGHPARSRPAARRERDRPGRRGLGGRRRRGRPAAGGRRPRATRRRLRPRDRRRRRADHHERRHLDGRARGGARSCSSRSARPSATSTCSPAVRRRTARYRGRAGVVLPRQPGQQPARASRSSSRRCCANIAGLPPLAPSDAHPRGAAAVDPRQAAVPARAASRRRRASRPSPAPARTWSRRSPQPTCSSTCPPT